MFNLKSVDKCLQRLIVSILFLGVSGSAISAVKEKSFSFVDVGEAYDTFRETYLENVCVEGEEASRQVSQVYGHFSKLHSLQTLQRELGFETSANFHKALAKANPKAQFAMKLADGGLSETFLFKHRIVNQIIKLRNPYTLSRYLENKEDFIKNCGDNYVSAVEMGGDLNVAVQFYFKNQNAQYQFGADLGLNLTLASLEARINSLSQFVKENTLVQLSYHIEGGNPKRFREFFSGEDFVKCELTQFSHCQKLITQVIDYVQGPFSEDIDKNPVTLSTNKASYPQIDALQLRNITAEIINGKKNLAEIAQNLYQDRRRGEILLDVRKGHMQYGRIRSIENALKSISRNIETINYYLISCLENTRNCLISPALEQYDAKALDPLHDEILPSAKLYGEGMLKLFVPPHVDYKMVLEVNYMDSWSKENIALLQFALDSTEWENADELYITKSKLQKEWFGLANPSPQVFKMQLNRANLGILAGGFSPLNFTSIEVLENGKVIKANFFYQERRDSILRGVEFPWFRGSLKIISTVN